MTDASDASQTSFGFQVVAFTAPGDLISDELPTSIELPEPVGRVACQVSNHAAFGELILRRSGYAARDDALRAGQLLKSWINVASALNLLTLDTGDDVLLGGLGAEARERIEAEQGIQIVPDVHGLVVFASDGRPTARAAARASASVTRDPQRVQRGLLDAATFGAVSEPADLAARLISVAEHQRHPDQRMIGTITGLEAMTALRPRGELAAALVERFVSETEDALANAAEGDHDDVAALLNAIRGLRTESTRSALRREARSASPDDPEAAAQLVNLAYDRRSRVSHGRAGASSDVDGSALRALAQAMLRARLVLDASKD